MATQAAAVDSTLGDSCSLDLPSASDVRDYVLRSTSPGPRSESLSSLETHPVAEPDSSSLNTEQKDSWTFEDLWLGPSAKGQLKAKEEDSGLRESLDRFYEVFGRPQPASEDPLSASVCRCLSRKITELRGQGSRKYALRSFQMARVIFARDGCSALRRHCRDSRFYPLHEGSVSLDDEKQTPGLSKDIIRFLLQQNLMKDP
ncbi:PREDICTED: uncharacterized protein C20orf196 homolog [Chinchilla lanigera]|uniref:Shieldin complex subunit 1 n=1 Tax=Chinchilla lanigera TaxID=34839 RepID=A0A8C2VTX4_CHILA|nr:PREDICTED: uncharacterized protein C20orf196 homolog [Chinchilla lanigera]XP_005380897.1 PREDICTED: uncharacterized protein C20orf196 homolog [Chinchilla lanigera]XP_005380898.1 PREDICTED: uncharacterized protein C20orf196 homolog [Chinchilla lanigera]XP_005380899.1 PREDICTED: uncharacterized protein C20orf196 homolog [Chinchilla lanigera]